MKIMIEIGTVGWKSKWLGGASPFFYKSIFCMFKNAEIEFSKQGNHLYEEYELLFIERFFTCCTTCCWFIWTLCKIQVGKKKLWILLVSVVSIKNKQVSTQSLKSGSEPNDRLTTNLGEDNFASDNQPRQRQFRLSGWS